MALTVIQLTKLNAFDYLWKHLYTKVLMHMVKNSFGEVRLVKSVQSTKNFEA